MNVNVGDFVLALLVALLIGLPRIVMKQGMVQAANDEFGRIWSCLSNEDRCWQACRMTSYHLGLRAWSAIVFNVLMMTGIGLVSWLELQIPPSFGTFVSCLLTFYAMVIILVMEPQRVKRAARECKLPRDRLSNACIDCGFAVAIGLSLLVRFDLTGNIRDVVICMALAALAVITLWILQRRMFAFAATIPHLLS